MLCKMCGGVGTVSGTFYRNGKYVSDTVACKWCNGTGKIKQTNEKWFCSLPTEEKAKEMCVIMADMAEANDGVWDEKMIEAWLKEEHHE